MKIGRSFTLYMVMVCLILLGAASAWSQTGFNVKIYAEDGSTWKDSILVGKYTAATDAYGDSLTPVLVEHGQPPAPPAGAAQAADFRLTDPTGGNAADQGVKVDLRKLVSSSQKDKYLLKFRRSAPDGTGITLTWPDGLETVGGHGWWLIDGLGNFLFEPVDMTHQTSFTYPGWSALSGGFAYIVSGLPDEHRTFTNEELATGKDLKGKVGKSEKPKPTSVDFQFTLTAAAGAGTLTLGFDKIAAITLSFPDDPAARVPQNLSGLKAYVIAFSPALIPGQEVVVTGNGSKGKAMKTTYFFDAGAKVALTTYDYQWLRLPMPNTNNIGEEMYVAGANLGIGIASTFHNITLPKWKDAMSTLQKQPSFYQTTTPAWCLDTLKGKAVSKSLKSLAPDKTIRYATGTSGNKLIGELIALKFNIAASAKGKTPALGFGSLIFKTTGHPYHNMTVDQIAAAADSALSCVGGLKGTYTYTDLANFLATLNLEFSGAFDTARFAGGTIASGVKPLVLSDILVSSGATFDPVPPTDYSSLYDVPKAFSLSQNYPNPFNPSTRIEFSLPMQSTVTLKIYNALGQEVATVLDQESMEDGPQEVEFNASSLPSGVYFYRISAEGIVDETEGEEGQFLSRGEHFVSVKKMILLR